MARRVPDPVARTLRGSAQGSVAYALDVLVASVWHMTNEQFGAILVLITAAVTITQNYFENRLGWALLRNMPTKPVPVVDEVPEPPKKITKKTTSGGRRRASG